MASKARHIRDCGGLKPAFNANGRKGMKRKAQAPIPGDLSSCPRWAALRQRIIAKTSEVAESSEVVNLLIQ